MNSRQDFSPIRIEHPGHPVGLIPAAFLEAARVQPCYEGADDMGEYAQAMKTPRWVAPTDYDALVTRNQLRETTIRRMVNNTDQADAVEWLVARGEISAELAERIEEVSMEFAENRLNRSQA